MTALPGPFNSLPSTPACLCSEEQIKNYLEKTLGEAPRPQWGVSAAAARAFARAPRNHPPLHPTPKRPDRCSDMHTCLAAQRHHAFLWSRRSGPQPILPALSPTHHPARCPTAGTTTWPSSSPGPWAVQWTRSRQRSAPSASRAAGAPTGGGGGVGGWGTLMAAGLQGMDGAASQALPLEKLRSSPGGCAHFPTCACLHGSGPRCHACTLGPGSRATERNLARPRWLPLALSPSAPCPCLPAAGRLWRGSWRPLACTRSAGRCR